MGKHGTAVMGTTALHAAAQARCAGGEEAAAKRQGFQTAKLPSFLADGALVWLERLFGSEQLLPSQALEHAPALAPTQALWFAVLGDALRDLRYAAGTARRLDAEAWFSSAQTTLGSFRWLCDVFDVDADRFRARVWTKLRRLPKGRRTKASPRAYSVQQRRRLGSRVAAAEA